MANRSERFRRFLIRATMALVMIDPALAVSAPPMPRASFDALVQLERSPDIASDAQRTQALRTLYEDAFAGAFAEAALKQASEDNLRALFGSADLVAYHSNDAAIVEQMHAAFAELQRRGIATPYDHQRMFGAFFAARMLGAASDFHARHPDMGLQALPAFGEAPGIAPGTPSEWAVSPLAAEVTRQPFHLDASPRIVVVAHPLCHFSQNAVRDIFADPQLRAVFAKQAHWLAPPDRELELSVFQQWNREHPQAAMTIAYQQSEWPLLDDWATPIFYFLRDGAVLAKVVGWPPEGHLDELREASQRIGFLTRPAPTN